MRLGTFNRNNLANFALAIKQDACFLSIEVDRAALTATFVQHRVEIMKRINLRQDGGKLITQIGVFLRSPLFNNLRNLGIGHPRMRVHHRFVKLVFGDIALATDLHLADHTQTILPRIQRAEAIGQLLRQHRHHMVGEVD